LIVCAEARRKIYRNYSLNYSFLQRVFAHIHNRLTRSQEKGYEEIGSREYWAAIPDFEKRLTRVGRYDTRTFRFKPLMEIPDIRFASDDMWVDEAARRIYLAYNGHLLRLPLTIKHNSSGK
jgi:hypothetical protein